MDAHKNVSDICVKCTKEDVFGKTYSTCLKGIAIVMMMIHHCFMGQDRYEGMDIVFVIPEAVWNYAALFFKICVCIFAFISAYGLTKKLMALEQSGKTKAVFMKEYIISRLLRLMGGFIIVFLLVDLFALFYDPGRFASIYGSYFPDCLEYWAIDLLGLAEFFGTPTFMGTWWYYSLAIIIVFLVPVFYRMLRGIGSPAVFLGIIAIINFTVEIPNADFFRYLLCIASGVVCANYNVITKIVSWRIGSAAAGRVYKFFAEAAVMLLFMVLREGPLKNYLYPIWDAVIPVVTAAFCCEFIFSIIPLRKITECLGRYSSNIFLVHSFIRVAWFHDFTYSFRYPLLIVAVLLGISLVLSVLIEQFKKLVRYNKLIENIIVKLNA